MPTEQEFALIRLLDKASKGFIKCTQQLARQIIDLVKTTPSGYVIRKRHAQKAYEIVQIIHTTREKMEDALQKAKAGKQYEGFYQYECYAAEGHHLGSFYSINPNLFN